MKHVLGIRREDKSIWERRVPITPEDARSLVKEHSLEIAVQPSTIRVFPDQQYREVGVAVEEDLSRCDVVVAVKEIPARAKFNRPPFMVPPLLDTSRAPVIAGSRHFHLSQMLLYRIRKICKSKIQNPLATLGRADSTGSGLAPRTARVAGQ